MSRFKHSHVMGLIGVCLDSGPAPYIVMPYMANGSLLQYLKKERDHLVLPDNADDDEVYSNVRYRVSDQPPNGRTAACNLKIVESKFFIL